MNLDVIQKLIILNLGDERIKEISIKDVEKMSYIFSFFLKRKKKINIETIIEAYIKIKE